MVPTHSSVGSLIVYNTSATFTSTNVVLKKGQIGKEEDTNRYKQGDGVTAWQDLTHAEWGFEIVETAGTGTYAASFSKPFLLAYFPMMLLRVRFGAPNVGATTLNLNGLGAVTIVKNVSATLADGDIVAGGIYELAYDGTNFQLLGSGLGSGSSLSTFQFQFIEGMIAFRV